MEVILKQDYQKLGYANDIVTVKPGFARNFLFPKGIAVPATPVAIKVRNEVVKQQAHKTEKIFNDASSLAEAISAVKVTIPVKATDEGKIFGSVTAAMISDYLKEKHNYDVDKKLIDLSDERIKEIGQYVANIRLYKGVEASLNIEVINEDAKKGDKQEPIAEVIEEEK